MPSRFQIALQRFAAVLNSSLILFWFLRLIGYFTLIAYIVFGIDKARLAEPYAENLSIYASYLRALSPIIMSGSAVGAIFSYLLQTIRVEECGIEIGVIYRRKYRHYLENLVCLIISGSIVAFLLSTVDKISIWFRIVLSTNIIGLASELLYVATMTYSFLVRQSARKANTYLYIANEIWDVWSKSQFLCWRTAELECMVKDSAYSARQYYSNPAIKLFDMWTLRFRYYNNAMSNRKKHIAQDTYQLVGLFYDSVPNRQIASEALGSIIYGLYTYKLEYGPLTADNRRCLKSCSNSLCLNFQAEKTFFDHKPPFAQSSLLGKIATLIHIGMQEDIKMEYILPNEKADMLIVLLTSWAEYLFYNYYEIDNGSHRDAIGSPKMVRDCIAELFNAIIHAETLCTMRRQDKNSRFSNLRLLDTRTINRINDYAMLIWCSALCYCISEDARFTDFVMDYNKEFQQDLAKADMSSVQALDACDDAHQTMTSVYNVFSVLKGNEEIGSLPMGIDKVNTLLSKWRSAYR